MNPHHRSEARQVGVADATAAMIHAIQFGGAMESPGRKGSVEDVGEPFKNMFFLNGIYGSPHGIYSFFNHYR